MGIESAQKTESRRTQLRPEGDDVADRLREAPPRPPEIKPNEPKPNDQKPSDPKASYQKPSESSAGKLNDQPSSSPSDQQPADYTDIKAEDRKAIVIQRNADNTARARDESGNWHEGKMIGDTFIGHDDKKNTDWIVRPDGSQSIGKYNYDIHSQKPSLNSLTEISAKGERLEFKQDALNQNRLVRTSSDGSLVEERFHTNLDSRGAAYWDDKENAGISTIVLGDSTVEHGNIIFGNANDALAFRENRRKIPENQHINPMTSPTFCLDERGRVSAILAPERGGAEGCNDSAKGGTDRFFTYTGDSKKLADVGEMTNKGDYADIMYHSTRQGDSDKWTIQLQSMEERKVPTFKKDDEGRDIIRNGRLVYDTDEEGRPIFKTEKVPRQPPFTAEYQGPIGFEPGTLDLVWQERLRPNDKNDLRKYAVINHPDGAVDRVYNSFQTDNGRANGNVLYHLDRYLNKDLDLNHPIGIQHRDARNNKVGQPYKLGNVPGLDLLSDGSVKFKDKEGNQHRIGPDHQELVLNTTDQIYLKKDATGRIRKSGGLVVTNPAASFAARAYKMDELNFTEYNYSREDSTVQIIRTVDGKPEPPTSVKGLMRPNGELWHMGSDGTSLVEKPDSSTVTIYPEKNGRPILPTTFSYSNNEISSKRTVIDDPEKLDFAIDELSHKDTKIKTRFTAMSADEAGKLGLDTSLQYYYLTRSTEINGKQTPLIAAPKFDSAPRTPQEFEERRVELARELQMVFINPQVLANGSIQATALLNRNQVRFNLPKTPQDLFQPPIIDTATHLANSKEKFESLIKKHHDQFIALLKEGKAFSSQPQMNTSVENWAATQFNITLPTRGQPRSPEQAEQMARELAFSYDVGIAQILASQNRNFQPAQPFAPPVATPGSKEPATWNAVIDQLHRAQAQQAEQEKAKTSSATKNPKSLEAWETMGRITASILQAWWSRR